MTKIAILSSLGRMFGNPRERTTTAGADTPLAEEKSGAAEGADLRGQKKLASAGLLLSNASLKAHPAKTAVGIRRRSLAQRRAKARRKRTPVAP